MGKNLSKTFLHVGCGKSNKSKLKGFNSEDWHETRFDIDKNVKPDIVGTMTDISIVKNESFDAIYSSHNIEHLYPHEVTFAIDEFYRVLKSDGFVVITCPDLISVCKAVVNDNLLKPLYQSPAGPISPIDIIYGHRGFIANGNEFMAHKCGFTYSVLCSVFYQAGFKDTLGGARPNNYDLWLVAFKNKLSKEDAQNIAFSFLP